MLRFSTRATGCTLLPLPGTIFVIWRACSGVMVSMGGTLTFVATICLKTACNCGSRGMYVLLYSDAKLSDKPQRGREHHQRPVKNGISVLLSGFQIAPEVVDDFEET